MTRARLACSIVAVTVLAVALAIVVAAFGLPLTNDGPAHAFAAFARNHLGDAGWGFTDRFVAGSPWSNHAAPMVFRIVERAAGWRAAYVAMHVVAVEVWAFGAFALVTALGRGRFAAALLVFPLALQTLFYFGVLSYLIAVGIAFVAAAVWVRAVVPSLRSSLVVGLLVLVAAVCHSVAACVGVGLLAAVDLARTSWRAKRWTPRSPAVTALRLGAIGVSAPMLALLVRDVALGSEGEPAFADVIDRTVFVLGQFVPGPWWRVVLVSLLCVAGVASYFARRRAGRARVEEAGLLAAGVLFVVVTMSLPRDLSGWQLAGARALPFAVVALLALADVDGLAPRVRRAAWIAVALFCVTSFAWSARKHDALARAGAPALDAIALLERGAATPRAFIPVVLGARLGDAALAPDHAPLYHLGQLAGIATGGKPAYGHFMNGVLHAVVEKRHVSLPRVDYWEAIDALDGQPRHDALRRLLAWIQGEGGLFLYGRPEDLAVARAAGYVDDPAVASDRAMFARFVGCDAVLRIENVREPISVAVGWWPLREPDRVVTVTPDHDGAGEAALPAFGCGDVWLHVEGRRCRGAEQPPLRASFAAGGDNRLVCVVQ